MSAFIKRRKEKNTIKGFQRVFSAFLEVYLFKWFLKPLSNITRLSLSIGDKMFRNGSFFYIPTHSLLLSESQVFINCFGLIVIAPNLISPREIVTFFLRHFPIYVFGSRDPSNCQMASDRQIIIAEGGVQGIGSFLGLETGDNRLTHPTTNL